MIKWIMDGKVYMRDYLDKSGGCGEDGVFMALKKPMFENIPLFYQ